MDVDVVRAVEISAGESLVVQLVEDDGIRHKQTLVARHRGERGEKSSELLSEPTASFWASHRASVNLVRNESPATRLARRGRDRESLMSSGANNSIFDVTIVGAGPAGAAATRLLASWGHSVVVIGRPPRHPPLAESLPPSCAKLFEQIGVRTTRSDAAKFVRATGNTVQWAGRDLRVEPFDVGLLGYQVARNDFDALMASEARSIGAEVYEDATVRDVIRAR